METLLKLAMNAGLPMITAALQDRLGDGGRLAQEVMNRVAFRAGVPPEGIDALAEATPGVLITALRDVEKAAPEMVQVYLSEVQAAQALAASESEEPLWARAWRPAGMYMIGFLWVWNVVILHVCNAIWKTALPPVPFDSLMQLSGLYMGLYMGGHTVKDIAARWITGGAK
jgi:hypothetical protein